MATAIPKLSATEVLDTFEIRDLSVPNPKDGMLWAPINHCNLKGCALPFANTKGKVGVVEHMGYHAFMLDKNAKYPHLQFCKLCWTQFEKAHY